MIGNAEQLLHRLVAAVEEWIEERPLGRQKSA
jgi:hypothetical protein